MLIAFDTNILINFAKNIPEAVTLVKKHPGAVISTITRTEFLSGKEMKDHRVLTRNKLFLKNFKSVSVNKKIAGQAALFRQQYKLKTADAIILATAYSKDAILFTSDKKDFQNIPNVITNF